MSGKELTASMIGIGMVFSGKRKMNPNIEDTLLSASYEGMERHDLRVLSVLVAWLEEHYQTINADRLIRIVSESTPRVKAFWSSMAKSLKKDRRFARLQKGYRGKRLDVLSTGTSFQIKRNGEDPRFKDTLLRVPKNILRKRKSDILSQSELVKQHRSYRYRILVGPSYRADMFAELENEPTLSTSELARRAYGSFATAWQVKNDWKLLNAVAV